MSRCESESVCDDTLKPLETFRCRTCTKLGTKKKERKRERERETVCMCVRKREKERERERQSLLSVENLSRNNGASLFGGS